jgi:hypothetical protein
MGYERRGVRAGRRAAGVSTTHVRIDSWWAARANAAAETDARPFESTSWEGDVPAATLEEIFRYFNVVDSDDERRLEAVGYRLPSLSVGDRVTFNGRTWRCLVRGWEEVSVRPAHKQTPAEFEQRMREIHGDD